MPHISCQFLDRKLLQMPRCQYLYTSLIKLSHYKKNTFYALIYICFSKIWFSCFMVPKLCHCLVSMPFRISYSNLWRVLMWQSVPMERNPQNKLTNAWYFCQIFCHRGDIWLLHWHLYIHGILNSRDWNNWHASTNCDIIFPIYNQSEQQL